MMQLNINSKAVVTYTNKLEKLHRKHLPLAIRGALNKTVHHVKTVTLLKTAKHAMVERDRNFFKSNSRFENATGFNVNTMHATVGMKSDLLKNSSQNFAVRDLEKVEDGGIIKGRAFIPLKQARVGNSFSKKVRTGNKISIVKGKYLNARKGAGKNRGQRFLSTAAEAGVGGFVLSERGKKGKRFIFRVNSLNKGKYGKIKTTPLFAYQKARKVNPQKGRNFMKRASLLSSKKTEGFYILEAKRQINIAMK